MFANKINKFGLYLSIIILANLLKIDQIRTFKGSQMIEGNHFLEESVKFTNHIDNIFLSGKLTLPKDIKEPKVAILISGYGPSNRDIEFNGHKPFKVLAEYLANNGVATLRYDKRGIGQSTGNFFQATSGDLANDVIAAVNYLKKRSDINQKSIGLIGLSEGGLIASIVASKVDDVAFILLLAPAVANKSNNLIDLFGMQLSADGATNDFLKEDRLLRKAMFEIIKNESNLQVAEAKLFDLVESYLKNQTEAHKYAAKSLPFAFNKEKADMLIKTFNGIWYRYFISYESLETLKKVKSPVLVIAGDKDWIAHPDLIFPILNEGFKKNSNYSAIKLPNINHMFRTCKTGAMSEYATIKETWANSVLTLICDWISALK